MARAPGDPRQGLGLGQRARLHVLVHGGRLQRRVLRPLRALAHGDVKALVVLEAGLCARGEADASGGPRQPRGAGPGFADEGRCSTLMCAPTHPGCHGPARGDAAALSPRMGPRPATPTPHGPRVGAAPTPSAGPPAGRPARASTAVGSASLPMSNPTPYTYTLYPIYATHHWA